MADVWRVKDATGVVHEVLVFRFELARGEVFRVNTKEADGVGAHARAAVSDWANSWLPTWREIAAPGQLFASEQVEQERERIAALLAGEPFDYDGLYEALIAEGRDDLHAAAIADRRRSEAESAPPRSLLAAAVRASVDAQRLDTSNEAECSCGARCAMEFGDHVKCVACGATEVTL